MPVTGLNGGLDDGLERWELESSVSAGVGGQLASSMGDVGKGDNAIGVILSVCALDASMCALASASILFISAASACALASSSSILFMVISG